MRNDKRAGWTTSLTPTPNDFFSTRKKASEVLLDILTASPNSRSVLKPAIMTGGPFHGTVSVCETKEQIRNWGQIAIEGRKKK